MGGSRSGRVDLRRWCPCGGLRRAAGAEERLQELGIELPGVQPAVGNYLLAKRDGNLIFVSGHVPVRVDRIGRIPGKATRDIVVPEDLGAVITGKVGADLSV